MWNGFDFVCVCVYQYRFNLKEIIVFIPIVKNNAHVQLADMESKEKNLIWPNVLRLKISTYLSTKVSYALKDMLKTMKLENVPYS